VRFMILVKADQNSEAGVLPSEQLLTEMGKFNDSHLCYSFFALRAKKRITKRTKVPLRIATFGYRVSSINRPAC